MGGADDFAAFAWLFSLFEDMVISILVASEPVIGAVANVASSLVFGAGVLWLILLLLRFSQIGLFRGLVGGAVVFAVVVLGLQESTLTVEGRAPIKMFRIQQIALSIAFTVNQSFANALKQVVSSHTIAGSIMPAERATEDATARAAGVFGNTDLARLIRDYNQQCSPDESALAGPEHLQTRDAYFAVGLLGGQGLGIPAEKFSAIAQIRSGASAAVQMATGMFMAKGIREASKTKDLSAIGSRRQEGVQALEAAHKDFLPSGGNTSYVLPTKSYWKGVYAGSGDTTADYLPLKDLPADLASDLEPAIGVWDEAKGKGETLALSPRSCVEAYRLAQFSAEQAYLALEEVGTLAAGDQSASSESGLVGSAVSWQKVVSKTIAGGTPDKSDLAVAAGGAMGAIQMTMNGWEWAKLQTVLPAFAAACAALLGLVIILAPLALLVAILRGVEVLVSWMSMVAFCVLLTVMIQVLLILASFLTAGVAVEQAAAAAGWIGSFDDLDIIRGGMGMSPAVLIPVCAFIAAQWTGMSFGGLAGSAGGAVATADHAAKIVTAGVSLVTGGRSHLSGGRNRADSPSPSGGGDGGGRSRGARSAPGASGSSHSIRQTSLAVRGASASPERTARVRSKISLNPTRPINDDSFAQGRTPRSLKPKTHKDETKDE